MTDETTGGNAVESPTTDTGTGDAAASLDTTTGQETTTDSQAVDTGDVKGEESSLPDKETLPFDQHPKWISARQTEKRVGEILNEHGFDSLDDLVSVVNDGQNLKSILGNRDAEELVNGYEELQRYKSYWAQKKAEEMEANEQPHETIERVKREKLELEEQLRRIDEERRYRDESAQIVDRFDNMAKSAVQETGLSDLERQLIHGFLGLDNEISSVDPADPVASKRAINTAVQKCVKLIEAVKQEGIDTYAKGKGQITPITGSDASTAPESVKTKDEFPKGMSMSEFNAYAKDQLVDRLLKAADAP